MKQYKHHIQPNTQIIGVQTIYEMKEYRQKKKKTQKQHRSKSSNETTHTNDSNGRKDNDRCKPTKKRLKRTRPKHEAKQNQCNKQEKQ